MEDPSTGADRHVKKNEDDIVDEEVAQQRKIVESADKENGLSSQDAEDAMAEWGPNELAEEEVNMFLKFLSYFWGPMPIMIWVAIIVEIVRASTTGDGWIDFAVLFVLQFLNGIVGFIEERNAGNAIAALKEQLAPACRVKRDGKWTSMPSRELVPKDLVGLKLGDVVPADCILLDGEPVQVDQAALTGESLPVTIYPGGKVKMGSSIKRGEINAIVIATGKNTFFGKAADMMKIEDTRGRFQKVLFKVTLGLLALSVVLCSIIFIDLLVNHESVLRAISVVVVLLVASIPIAMQVVCTSTMAVGSRRLAAQKVIVARLSAIEELAGMRVLCSDKTGTLTLNKLSLREPIIMTDMSENELIFHSALASVQDPSSQDAIDHCICAAMQPVDAERIKNYTVTKYIPFNPTDKRTEGTITDPNGNVLRVTKGAPQVILNMAHNAPEIKDEVDAAVQGLADRGFRALGVAISRTALDNEPVWEFQGVLSLFDPPRVDTKDTIDEAKKMGVEVKMVTGDQTAIAKETCRELGMGTNILNTDILTGKGNSAVDLDEVVLGANGFAEVFPEHKFQIVDRIRKQGYVVGMTGDGVNDAPALKRADIGVAVEGATDAAKAAADIVLIEPGLSVITDAIRRSRKIFQRMRNYSLYRIACTIQILFFFFFAVIALNPRDYYDDNFALRNFTLPVIALVLITILNDGTIITIARDKVIPAKEPQGWDLREVVIISGLLGAVGCASSILLLSLGLMSGQKKRGMFLYHFIKSDRTCGPDCCEGTFYGNDICASGYVGWTEQDYILYGEIQTMMYLQISLGNFLTVFASRTKSFFFERRPGYALASAFVVSTTISTALAVTWPFPDDNDLNNAQESAHVGMTGLKGNWAAVTVWVYCLIWFFVQDTLKVIMYRILKVVRPPHEDELDIILRRGKVTNMIESDVKAHRKVDGVVRQRSALEMPEGLSAGSDLRLGDQLSQSQIVGSLNEIRDARERIFSLEREVRQLRQMLRVRDGDDVNVAV